LPDSLISTHIPLEASDETPSHRVPTSVQRTC
jgi:hypothetical protein